MKLEDIEQNMANGYPPTEKTDPPTVGGYYLAVLNDPPPNTDQHSAYRVQVEAIDDGQACCFFVDEGFKETIPFDKLYELDESLSQFPVQGINFSLFKLEDFADNPQASDAVRQLISAEQFAVSIKSTQAQYKKDGKISVLMFDPTKDNQMMNKKVLETACAEMQPPRLEMGKTNLIHVTHIADSGLIYCCLHSSKELTHIKELIKRLTSDGLDDRYRVTPDELIAGSSGAFEHLCIVFDSSEKKWYRAQLVEFQPQRTTIGKAKCLFVDYGVCKFIEISNIYSLQTLSMALNNYPTQSIAAWLHGLKAEEYTPQLVNRLRVLLCGQKTLLAKVVGESSIPSINVWKRIESLLCKINETLRMEIEMEE